MEDEEDKLLQQLPNRIKKWQPRETFQDSQPVPILPTEIVVEILLRLPVESLLRCRSVCKLWCSLISDPSFVKSHLSLSTSRNHYEHHRLCLLTSNNQNDHARFKICHLYDVLSDNPINYANSEVDYPNILWIFGSCNGLLCISFGQDSLFVWNPSTRKYNNLPHAGYKRKPGYPIYGFGYDESTDDYKVVEVYRFVNDNKKFDSLVNIYSLKTGLWKEIDAFPNNVISFHFYSQFSNGALHWFALTLFQSWTIISLDLAKETYGEVLQPDYDDGDKDLTLGVFKEQLCVICDYRRIRMDFWVMKDYGVKESWTKFVSFGYLADLGRLYPPMPLWIINDGKILLGFGEKVIVYDSENSSFLDLKNLSGCVRACSFVESLVSPIP